MKHFIKQKFVAAAIAISLIWKWACEVTAPPEGETIVNGNSRNTLDLGGEERSSAEASSEDPIREGADLV